MPQPPEWFVRALSVLDSGLHVRWGGAVQRWVIDRDAAHISDQERFFLARRVARAKKSLQATPDDIKKQAWLAALTEENESARANRRVILYAGTLDQKIFNSLMERDIQQYGGYCRAIYELESAEIRQAELAQRAQSSHNLDLAYEVLDQVEFVERKKQSELDAGVSWQDLLKSGRSSGVKTGIGSLGEYKVIDRRSHPKEEKL